MRPHPAASCYLCLQITHEGLLMASLVEQILDALRKKPMQTADELARALDTSKSSVRNTLNHSLKSKVRQNRLYQWSLCDDESTSKDLGSENAQKFANTDLARLCQYYLACIGYDNPEISTPAQPTESGADYYECSSIPDSHDDLLDNEAIQQLLERKRTEKGRFGLYFGYPTNVSSGRDETSKSKIMKVEPLILLPIEQDPETRLYYIDINFPIVNQTAVRNCANLEDDDITSETAELERALGFTESEGYVQIDEIAPRLQNIRPDWRWNEDIDPDSLGDSEPPLCEVTNQGVYNRAVVIMVEKSPYTAGLEHELQELAKLSEAQYEDTVLGNLVKEEIPSNESDTSDKTLLEVEPMNLEQRQAVQAGLTRTLTVVTGPPGTGKSQVATNLIVNAAWRGKRVLFASKNNKAVDVLEERVNRLASRDILLRLGPTQYQRRLAECLLEMLNATATTDEKDSYGIVELRHKTLLEKYESLEDESKFLITARNKVDDLEKTAETARKELGAELFKVATTVDNKRVSDLTIKLRELNSKADLDNARFFERLFWNFVKKERFQQLSDAVSIASNLFNIMHTEIPKIDGNQDDVKMVYESCKKIDEQLKLITQLVVPYQKKLSKLQKLRTLEEITIDQLEILKEIAQNSRELWKLWVRILPSNLSAKEKKKLSNYKSLLDMVSEGDSGGDFSYEIFTRYVEMLNDILYLLPCWAVTSLSVRRRIPFTPKIFDLVVIDEASQCDIASALPLLYRAKSVVIIGDSMQLTHISRLPNHRNQNLWKRFGITEDSVNKFLDWNYSKESLFDLCYKQLSDEKTVHLLDHHRSHADIINFSNDEFYDSRLRVATNYDLLSTPDSSTRGVRWYDVTGIVKRPANGSAVNHKEAREVVRILRQLLKKFSGNVGIVTPFRAQANLIRSEVNKDKELSLELSDRDFLVETVHKFQGDERDVMFFSPVVSKNFPEKSLGFLQNRNLFNVAITRARAKLLVVGDRTACETSKLNLLSTFAKYVGNLSDSIEEQSKPKRRKHGKKYPVVANPEKVSNWEHTFYEAAYEAGIRLEPQYTIEKYVVDFLLVEGKRKLVIEIDGETYHKNYTGDLCRRDQLRNIRLFELGYDVVRFWVYEVRDELESCINKLREWKERSPE